MKKLIVLLLISTLSMTSLTACSFEETLGNAGSIIDSGLSGGAKDILEQDILKEKVNKGKEILESGDIQKKTGEAIDFLKENQGTIDSILQQAGKQIGNAE